MVREGQFRQDLYYRLSVFEVMLPPLRDRSEDIPLLIEDFLERAGKKGQQVTPEALNKLKSHRWEGNVRELKNIIERIMILRDVGRLITPENIPAEIKASAAQDPVVQVDELLPLTSASDRIDYKQAVEKLTGKIKERILTRALQLSGGNKTKAAQLLKISRYALIRELKKVGKDAETGT